MRNINTFLGLPERSLNILSGALGVVMVCLGIRIVKAPNLALKVANTQLVTGSSADKLERLARELEEQAVIIKQKDEAYNNLQQTYKQYLTNQKGGIELDKAFDEIKNLPQVENIEEIQTEIIETEADLSEVTSE